MYKYLILKSIADCYFGLKNVIAPIFRCESDCIYAQYYATKVASVIFYFYLGHICEFLSLLYELLANFDRYSIITRKFTIQNSRTAFRIILSCSLALTLAMYLYVPIEQRIYFNAYRETNPLVSSAAKGYYVLRYDSKLHHSDLFVILRKLSVGIRDAVMVMLLLFIDILTVIKLRQSMKAKRKLTQHQPETSSMFDMTACRSVTHLKSERAEQNITKMVLINGFLHVIVHSLLFFFHVAYELIIFPGCYKLLMKLLLDLSKCAGFFIYFYFNKQFRRCFKNMIVNCLTCLRCHFLVSLFQDNNHS